MILTLEPLVRADDLFDSLGSEDEQELLVPELKRNKKLDEIVSYSKWFAESINYYYEGKQKEIYEKMQIPSEYSPSDIAHFTLTLSDYHDSSKFGLLGLYISKLINESRANEFVLPIPIGETISHLGFNNDGNQIKIKGNVGHYVGMYMKDGKIIISGNAEDSSGRGLEGGIITIQGNSRLNPGLWMRGGTLIINGDVTHDVGSGMTGGVIKLNGDYDSISEHVEGGNIYHKGKLIVENGRVK